MGNRKTFFSFLFSKKKKILKDSVFGVIEFDGFVWTHIPKNTEKSFMIIINAPSTGPTQAQRDFYISLKNDLNSLEEECKTFIFSQEEPPLHLQVMTIYSIEIGEESEVENGQFVIELSDKDANEIHRVKFMNGKPSYYEVDD